MNNAMNGMQQAQQPQSQDSVTGLEVIPITMVLNSWNGILEILGTAPWKAANPLIGELHKQIGAELQRQKGQPQEISQARPSLTT
jgi:hypothetical protein